MAGGEMIVKRRTEWTKERRFVMLEAIFDDQDTRVARFVRCQELLDSGSGQQFLMKRVRLRTEEDTRKWSRDLHMLSQLRNPYILCYKDAWLSRDVQHVLCENARMCLSVCLRQMAKNGETGPSPELYPRWMFHIASALMYLHEQNNEDKPMLHRDLQPDNILVTDSCVLKLCAFDTSKRLESKQSTTKTVMGGGLFHSPESRHGKSYDQSVDIWSFAVTCVYIAHYDRACKAASPQKLMTIMKESGQDQKTQRVVEASLRDDPDQRPKASRIVKALQDLYSQHGGKDWLQCVPSDLFPAPLLDQSNHSTQVPGRHADTPAAASSSSRQVVQRQDDLPKHLVSPNASNLPEPLVPPKTKNLQVKPVVSLVAQDVSAERVVSQTAQNVPVERVVSQTAQNVSLKRAVSQRAQNVPVQRVVSHSAQNVSLKRAVSQRAQSVPREHLVPRTAENVREVSHRTRPSSSSSPSPPAVILAVNPHYSTGTGGSIDADTQTSFRAPHTNKDVNKYSISTQTSQTRSNIRTKFVVIQTQTGEAGADLGRQIVEAVNDILQPPTASRTSSHGTSPGAGIVQIVTGNTLQTSGGSSSSSRRSRRTSSPGSPTVTTSTSSASSSVTSSVASSWLLDNPGGSSDLLGSQEEPR